MTHTCVSRLTIICSDNGLWTDGRQAIIGTNAGILLIGPCEQTQWNLNRNLYIFTQENKFENVVWKLRPFWLGLSVLIDTWGPHVIIATFYVWMSKLSEGYIFRFFSLGQTPKVFWSTLSVSIGSGDDLSPARLKAILWNKRHKHIDINIDKQRRHGQVYGNGAQTLI